MARYYLLTRARSTSGPLFPGTLLDDAQDPVTAIVASGARTYPAPNATLAAAAARCEELRLRGGGAEQAEALMLEAASRAEVAAIPPAAGGSRFELYSGLLDVGFAVSFNEQTAGPQAIEVGPGLRSLKVVFPAAAAFTTLSLAGTTRGGVAQTATVTSPGAGGGTVDTPEVWATVAVTNDAPGGDGSHDASIYPGDRVGVGAAPVASFDRLVVDGSTAAPASSDLSAGWFSPGVVSNASSYAVSYTAG